MGSSIKKTLSHGTIYALGDIIRNLTSFIMLPIYTSFLTPEDYGVLELLSMLIDFVSIVLGMRVGEAVFRYYCNTDSIAEKRQVITTALILVTVLNGAGVFLIWLFSDVVSTLIFGTAEFQRFVGLFTFVLVLQAIIEVSLVYIRALQKPWLFILVSSLRLALQLSLNIYLVVYKNMHVEGVIYSALIANSIIACGLLLYVFINNGVSFSKSMAKELSLFSLPLMLASIGSFYLTFGDRFFLRIFSDLAEVGIYSLGYKFGFMLLMIAWIPFEKIWDTQRYEIYNDENLDTQKTFGDYFIYISSFIIFVALGIALFVDDLLVIMSSEVFHSAHQIVPLILFAYILQAWTAFSGFGLLLKKKTKHFTYGSIFSVVVITIAYATLIPAYGAMGAALATIIGFLARLVWVYYHSNKAYALSLPWFKVMLLLSTATVTYLVSLFAPSELLLSIAVKILLVVIFIVVYFWLPILKAEEKKLIFDLIRNPLNFKKGLARK